MSILLLLAFVSVLFAIQYFRRKHEPLTAREAPEAKATLFQFPIRRMRERRADDDRRRVRRRSHHDRRHAA